MKFGVRECANITFKATSDRIVANKKFKKEITEAPKCRFSRESQMERGIRREAT